jgi:hypothetical protein
MPCRLHSQGAQRSHRHRRYRGKICHSRTFCKSFAATKSTSSEKKILEGRSLLRRWTRRRTNKDFAREFVSNLVWEFALSRVPALSPKPHRHQSKRQPSHHQNQNQQPANKQGRLPLLLRRRLRDAKEIDESVGDEAENSHSLRPFRAKLGCTAGTLQP